MNFAELQMLTMQQADSVAKSREQLDQISAIMRSRPEYHDWVEVFAESRDNFPVDALIEADAFGVDVDDTPGLLLPEELCHDSLGFVHNDRLVFAGRFVYPVKDTKGHVAGWCGYCGPDTPKYLDSKNYGYSAKNALFYGAERLPEYYKSDKPVIVVEGIVCCLWLRWAGFQALASLGSYLTPYMITVLKRFGRRVVVIPDADAAGNKYRAQVRRELPLAKTLQSSVAKDIDDSRKVCDYLAEDLATAIQPFGASKIFQ